MLPKRDCGQHFCVDSAEGGKIFFSQAKPKGLAFFYATKKEVSKNGR